MMSKYYLGIDVGSSSVKASIFDAEKGISVGHATFPPTEQPIDSDQAGWAEQDPELWWHNFLAGYAQIVSEHKIKTNQIDGIGISYQMHGLVAVDKKGDVLRKSIIWCDSRAVEIGETALLELGESYCNSHLLNSPGNFTASKLRWVKENEPDKYAQIHKFMLPGDYIAFRLSGEYSTTNCGLSEGVLWDFKNRSLSKTVLSYFGFEDSLIPEVVPNIGFQGTVSRSVTDLLGLKANVPITYRAGDQPNNAFSLGVMQPGEVATTAGTSGVIYAVTDTDTFDPQSRINTFLHVNDSALDKRNGVLVCVNGAGALYSWLKRFLNHNDGHLSYKQMNDLASLSEPGSQGVRFFPFGNGAERILGNRLIQANIMGLDFNRHNEEHVLRAGMEGIVFALNLGFDILKSTGVSRETIKAGHANLFLSQTFRTIFANVTQTSLLVFETDGADGAARGAALGAGFYNRSENAFDSVKRIHTVEPQQALKTQYEDIYGQWKAVVENLSEIV